MPSNQDLRARFQSELGPEAWDANWESVLRYSPEFLASTIKLSAVPRKSRHLPLKVQHLVALAVDSASTHLYLSGIRHHIAAALREGATPAEVMEVIELTSTLGIHACNIGVPVLVEVLREAGTYDEHFPPAQALDPRREALKTRFQEQRGYWHQFWDEFLTLDPDFFEAYLEFSSVPWVKGQDRKGGATPGLEPKVKELIYCAFDAAATHLYVPGLRLHMQNVLKYGGTPGEILEVLQIATLLSTHTAHAAAPILAQLDQSATGRS
ncbi:hypothetical protein F1880_009678 [Penicillium rolfsii]|nr:hypothetical protein F1880_009678 [Penicillium rolfsii]